MPSEPVAAARKINLNTATIEELSSLNGIGEKKAQAIIDYREKQGNFTSIEQLVDVSGVGPAILEKNKALISVQ
jgi:competence protein ComEA